MFTFYRVGYQRRWRSNNQGFATDMSVNIRQAVSFKVKSPSSKWRLDIYRMGYYNGNGARLVDTIQPNVTLPQVQPECFKEEATHLVDCGTWHVSATWQVPMNTTSGLYFVREDQVPQEYSKEGLNWHADHSSQREALIHARPGYSDYKLPEKELHSYGASGFGKLRNSIRGKLIPLEMMCDSLST